MRNLESLNRTKNAFTLIEILLYMAIVSVFILTLGTFFTLMVESNTRSEVMLDVNEQAKIISEIISENIRNSDGVNSLIGGGSSSNLSLTKSTPAINPTIFQLTNGNLEIKEGNSAAVILNSNRTEITQLQFTNLSKPGTTGLIRFEFTIRYKTGDSRSVLDYQIKYYGSATIKK